MIIFSFFLSFAQADEGSSDAPNYENPIRPLRPTTHPGDPNLTSGELENFRKLYFEILTPPKPLNAGYSSTQ